MANDQPQTRRDFVVVRAREVAAKLDDASLAARLIEYADDIERDTGRAYVPAFMREAGRRLAQPTSKR